MANIVTVISALGDNFIYLCRYRAKEVFVVDPGDARLVETAVRQQGIKLTHIFLTHHHFDHTAGADELKTKYGCQVISAVRSPLRLGDINIEVIATPGHTKDSVCYYVTSHQDKMVFTGDTLFVGGCGRPIECSRQQMWKSLEKLLALPDETLVYCGHDYTLDNYQFALSIEPDNPEVKKCIADLRAGRCPVPSDIGKEKKTNVLLRAGCVRVKSALGMAGAPAGDVFAELRRRKDVWG
jgi:hydroxyacylglutathione hydrolase